MFCFTASDCVAMSRPPTVALPEVGFSRPQSMRMVVDLPAPLGPRKPKISPRRTSRLTWSTATKVPKVLTRSCISTAFGSGGMFRLPYQADEDIFERRNDGAKTGEMDALGGKRAFDRIRRLAEREEEVE